MPKRFAIATGNWSDTATWDSGTVLGIPTASDDVWTNNQTVNINTSFIANSINTSGTTTNTTGLSAPMVTNCIIPNMTSFTTPEGLAFASSYAAGSEPWRAFDAFASSIYQAGTAAATIGYQFASPRNIKRYAWRAGTTAGSVPTRWTFEGSNNGTTYTILDTVTASLAAESVYTSTVLANTASFAFYRMNISATVSAGVTQIREIEMTESTGSSTGGASGGTFNFNTANVSASVTSTTVPVSLVVNNSITVTATTGTVNISAPSASFVGTGTATTQIINHSGNCDLVMTASSFGAGISNTTYAINKSSTGTITLVGNILGNASTTGTPTAALVSSAGNTIVIGTVAGSLTNANANNEGIRQSAGVLTVVGNVNGGTSSTSNFGINFSGTTLTVTGSVTGGSGATQAPAINLTGTPIVNTSGSITGTAVAGVSTTAAATITATGTLTAGAAGGAAISSTSTSAITTVRGSLINTNGVMAFYGPNLRLASGSLTTWRFTTNTGVDRTLYTLQQVGDQPSAANVRSGVSYAGGALTGTMAVPSTASVALGVPVDNTTGSAILNPTYVADEIWNQPTSTLTVPGSIGERIKNAATVQSTGAQIAALAGGN